MLTFLNTQSWNCYPLAETGHEDAGMKSIKEAVEHLSTHFREPLEAAGVGLSSLHDEIEDAVEYASKYLTIELDGCQKIWY